MEILLLLLAAGLVSVLTATESNRSPTKTKPLRVLLISHDYLLQGAQLFTYRLARSITLSDEFNIDVTLLSATDGNLRGLAERSNIKAFVAPSGNVMKFVLDNYDNYDIFQFNTLVSCEFAKLPNNASKPILFSVHESTLDPFMHRINYCSSGGLTSLFRRADHVTFVAQKTLEVYEKALNDSESSYSVIHGGVEVPYYDSYLASTNRSQCREQLNIPQDAFVVLVVGSVEERKGQLEVSRAVARLQKRFPNSNLLLYLVGHTLSTDYKDSCVSALGPTVKLIGSVQDTRPYYLAADVHILHAKAESLPFCLMEAAIMRLPLISTRNFGIIELIDHSVTGYLYDNADEIDKYLAILIENEQLRLTMGIKGGVKMRSEFTLSAMASAYASLYRSMATKPGLRPELDILPAHSYSHTSTLKRKVYEPMCSNSRVYGKSRRVLISYYLGNIATGDSYDITENNVKIFLHSLVHYSPPDSFYIVVNIDGGILNPFRQLVIELLSGHPSCCIVDWLRTASIIRTHALTFGSYLNMTSYFSAAFALNQGVRGPFGSNRKWIPKYLELLESDARVKFVGASISCETKPHVQTHFFGLHPQLLQLFVDYQLKRKPHPSQSRGDLIKYGDIELSRKILSEGHAIASMLHKSMFNISIFSGKCPDAIGLINPTGWCNLNPVDAIFVRYAGGANRLRQICSSTARLMNASHFQSSGLSLRVPERLASNPPLTHQRDN